MKYDVIIIGGGASGLFAGSLISKEKKTLILERTSQLGTKLLISGNGQCNITNNEDIKNFVKRYGENGKNIRAALYSFSNRALIRHFEENGIRIHHRKDGKVFPKSNSSKEIRGFLIKEIFKNEHEIKTDYRVTSIEKQDNTYLVNREYQCKDLIIATGGASYEKTGSDGSFFQVIKNMGIETTSLKPALSPINIESYPYKKLSGIAFKNVKMSIFEKNRKIKSLEGDLLLTHENLSGPLALHISRYIGDGQELEIDFLNGHKEKIETTDEKKTIENYLAEKTKLPKNFLDLHMEGLGAKGRRSNSFSSKEMDKLAWSLSHRRLKAPFVNGFSKAMVTSGGVSLDEINLKTFMSRKNKSLYIIGEALNIDGDTGGYNIQFAFSSAYVSAKEINKS